MPREALIDVLFAAFERYQFWNLRGITDYSNQPMAWLREVLNDIAIYHKRGPHKNMYELKPEYKVHHQPSDSGSQAQQAARDLRGLQIAPMDEDMEDVSEESMEDEEFVEV